MMMMMMVMGGLWSVVLCSATGPYTSGRWYKRTFFPVPGTVASVSTEISAAVRRSLVPSLLEK